MNNKERIKLTVFTDKIKQLTSKIGDFATDVVERVKDVYSRINLSGLFSDKKELSDAIVQLTDEEKHELETQLTQAIADVKSGKNYDIGILSANDNSLIDIFAGDDGNLKRFDNIDAIDNGTLKKDERIYLSQSALGKIDIDFLNRTTGHDVCVVVDYSKDLNYNDVLKMMEIQKQFDVATSSTNDNARKIVFCEFPQQTGVKPAEFSAQSVLNANLKLEEWASQINNAKIGGETLSPLEKYMCAYDIVTNFARFNLSKGSELSKSRAVSSILNEKVSNNEICCAGYANLLSALCGRLGINCILQAEHVSDSIYTNENSSNANHATARVFIDDPKYNVKGLFHADPCFDSIKKDANAGTLNNVLNPIGLVFNGNRQPTDFERAVLQFNMQDVEYMFNGGFINGQQSIKMLEVKDFFEKDRKTFDFYKKLGFVPTDEQIDKYFEKQKLDGRYKMELEEPDKMSKYLMYQLDFKELSSKYPLEKALEMNTKKYNTNEPLENDIYIDFEKHNTFFEQYLLQDVDKVFRKINDKNADPMERKVAEEKIAELKSIISNPEELKIKYHEMQRENVKKVKTILNIRDAMINTSLNLGRVEKAYFNGNIATKGDSDETRNHLVSTCITTRQMSVFQGLREHYCSNFVNNRESEIIDFPEKIKKECVSTDGNEAKLSLAKFENCLRDAVFNNNGDIELKGDIMNVFKIAGLDYDDFNYDGKLKSYEEFQADKNRLYNRAVRNIENLNTLSNDKELVV